MTTTAASSQLAVWFIDNTRCCSARRMTQIENALHCKNLKRLNNAKPTQQDFSFEINHLRDPN
jgi:hypothetical protein